MSKRNVTFLDDLPELNDLEKTNSNKNVYNPNTSIAPKYKRFIKKSRTRIPDQSGMNPKNVLSSHHHPHSHAQENEDNEHMHEENQLFQSPNINNMSPKNYRDLNTTPVNTCLDVASHVENCPICSQLYKNDRTLFIITIVILVVICALLLKKILWP